MTRPIRTAPLLLLGVFAWSCELPDSARCSDAEEYLDGGCYDIEPESTDTGPTVGDGGAEAYWFGAPCTCEGTGCDNMGSPVPTGGTISGCSAVPAVSGALLACLRTNASGLGPATYFANGFCSSMAASCTGNETICASAVVGDYSGMTACPQGTALLSSAADVDIMGMQATISSKTCVPLCVDSSDCRSGETDPALDGEASQYQCTAVGGVGFCYDPRNLNGGETAEAF